MHQKFLAISIFSIALVVAFFSTVLSEQNLEYIIIVSRFFDLMLPILAVGALIKYLFKDKNKFFESDKH